METVQLKPSFSYDSVIQITSGGGKSWCSNSFKLSNCFSRDRIFMWNKKRLSLLEIKIDTLSMLWYWQGLTFSNWNRCTFSAMSERLSIWKDWLIISTHDDVHATKIYTQQNQLSQIVNIWFILNCNYWSIIIFLFLNFAVSSPKKLVVVGLGSSCGQPKQFLSMMSQIFIYDSLVISGTGKSLIFFASFLLKYIAFLMRLLVNCAIIVGDSDEPSLCLCRLGGKRCAIDMSLKLASTFSFLAISITMLVTFSSFGSGIPSTPS